jgi:hypothetical protein
MLTLDLGLLTEAAIEAIHNTQELVLRKIISDPIASLEAQKGPTGKGKLAIDTLAELTAVDTLRTALGLDPDDDDTLFYLGEERLAPDNRRKPFNLTDERRLVVLADMVDGTDLLERGLWNWCSAMVFFAPQEQATQKVIAAFVGIPGDGIYYATCASDKPMKRRFGLKDPKKMKDVELGKVSTVATLSRANVCFYGQKMSSLNAIRKTRFFEVLEKLQTDFKRTRRRKLSARIYNLAGIPMMIKMIDGRNGLRKIDAVFEVSGQWPHDVVAGAYIAGKGGACLHPLDNAADFDNVNSSVARRNAVIYLEESLLHPDDENFKLRYVLAATESLSRELMEILQTEPPKRLDR